MFSVISLHPTTSYLWLDTTFGKMMRTINAYGLLYGLLIMTGIRNASAQEPHSFAIVDQLQATVTIQQENMEIVMQLPQGTKRQQINIGEWGEIAEIYPEDYNNDGYTDFSIAIRGNGYDAMHRSRVFLFQPAKEKYREVRLPHKYWDTEEWWGFKDPYFDETKHLVVTQEDAEYRIADRRAGYRRHGWKFPPQGDALLVESLRPVEPENPWTGLVPMTAIYTVFDETGDTLKSGAVYLFSPTDDMEPVILPVEQQRLYLHDAPNMKARSSMYLVQGDTYEVLNYVKGGWLKIRYVNPKRGNIDKYITVMEACSNHMDFYRDVFTENHQKALTIDTSETSENILHASPQYHGTIDRNGQDEPVPTDNVFLAYRPAASDGPYQIMPVSEGRDIAPLHGTAMERHEYRLIVLNEHYDLPLISNTQTSGSLPTQVVWQAIPPSTSADATQ